MILKRSSRRGSASAARRYRRSIRSRKPPLQIHTSLRETRKPFEVARQVHRYWRLRCRPVSQLRRACDCWSCKVPEDIFRYVAWEIGRHQIERLRFHSSVGGQSARNLRPVGLLRVNRDDEAVRARTLEGSIKVGMIRPVRLQLKQWNPERREQQRPVGEPRDRSCCRNQGRRLRNSSSGSCVWMHIPRLEKMKIFTFSSIDRNRGQFLKICYEAAVAFDEQCSCGLDVQRSQRLLRPAEPISHTGHALCW